MGFWSSLFDVANVVFEGVLKEGAKNIDRKSDEELEVWSDKSFNRAMETGKYNDFKTVDEYRDLAAKAHEYTNKNKI